MDCPRLVVGLALACGVVGCHEGTKAEPLSSGLARPLKKVENPDGPRRALLERLGGAEGLKRVADNLLVKLSGDDALPPAYRVRFLSGDREPQRKQLQQILGFVAGAEGGKAPDFALVLSDSPTVRRRVEELVEEAAEQAGVAALDRSDLTAAWQKAVAALQ